MRLILSLFKKKKVCDNGIRFVHLDETDSTNRYCLEELDVPLLADGVPARMVVVSTDYQSAGKGQAGNHWESARGKNLLFSILCHPVWIPLSGQFIISQAIAVAVRDALAELTDGITIKWPNDIYWKDRKICGILIESKLHGGHIKDCVVGVGLNANQLEFAGDAPNPVSLAQILGETVDRQALLGKIVERFDYYLSATQSRHYEETIYNYADNLYRGSGFHRYRDAEGEFEGAIIEVEDDGHLVLRDREGQIRTYMFKEVEFII